LLFALSCLAAAALGSVAVYQRGAQQRLEAADGTARLPPRVPAAGPPRPDPTLETLQLGDVVLDGDDDYVVVGTMAYREEQEGWHVHVLDAGTTRRFLEVKNRRGVLTIALLDAVADAPIHGQLGSGLTYRDKPLTLEARGDARALPIGETDGRGAGLLRYARYAGPGGALLLVEQLVEEKGANKRALYGATVPSSSLTIYPHA
jgi:hypothetical protein